MFRTLFSTRLRLVTIASPVAYRHGDPFPRTSAEHPDDRLLRLVTGS